MEHENKIAVLFVCLGNICRSPTAEAVFREVVKSHGLENRIRIDSCGTAGYHVGEPSDVRSQAAARQRGVDMSQIRGRQIHLDDFQTFDYILAMDEANLAELSRRCPRDSCSTLGLFLAYSSQYEGDVPDPYYGGEGGFSHVLDLVESASEGFVQELKRAL